MAIIRVASTAIAGRGSSTSYTISHAGGQCDACFVFIDRVSAVDVTGVTYHGTAMTELVVYTDLNNHIHSIWGLKDCYPGTHDVVITAPASATLRAGVVTYKGVHKTATFPHGSNTGASALTSVDVSITTTLDDCALLGLGSHNGLAATSVGAGTGTTAVSEADYAGSSDGIYESNPLSTGTAGVKTLQATVGQNAQDLSLLVVAIAPSTFIPVTGSPMII